MLLDINMCHQNVVWKFVSDCVRSNLRGSKFKTFLGGHCPQTRLLNTHTYMCMSVLSHDTIILLPSCFPPPPTQNPVWNPVNCGNRRNRDSGKGTKERAWLMRQWNRLNSTCLMVCRQWECSITQRAISLWDSKPERGLTQSNQLRWATDSSHKLLLKLWYGVSEILVWNYLALRVLHFSAVHWLQH